VKEELSSILERPLHFDGREIMITFSGKFIYPEG